MKPIVWAATFIASLLSGCSTERWEIDQAIRECETHRGVSEILDAGNPVASCIDGTVIKLHRPESK